MLRTQIEVKNDSNFLIALCYIIIFGGGGHFHYMCGEICFGGYGHEKQPNPKCAIIIKRIHL